ncbi:MAG: hypothetical protein ACRDV9_15215 [Acidimicrobiia bacterium]
MTRRRTWPRRATERRLRDHRGSAVVEMAVLGSLLLAGLSQAVVGAGAVQRMAFATSLAAREGGRAAMLANDPAHARAVLDAVVTEVVRNHGLARDSVVVAVTGGLTRGGRFSVSVTGRVEVARLAFGGASGAIAVPVQGRWAARVDSYRSIDEESRP